MFLVYCFFLACEIDSFKKIGRIWVVEKIKLENKNTVKKQ